jgi:hypothetical protein
MTGEGPTCARDGLAAVLRFDQLGAYNGSDGWFLMIQNLQDLDQMSMAETHEALHHDLQISSGWGLLSSGAQVLARSGFRPHALRELFLEMVEFARLTHETFATIFSATASGVEKARGLLAGNDEYSAYLERGLALVEVPDETPWQLRSAAIRSVLLVCMRPTTTLSLLQRGYRDIRAADLRYEFDAPDRRLAAFEELGGPASWQPVFDELAAEFPDRGGDALGERRWIPMDSPEFDRLRDFEEEVLLPRCHAHVCAILDEAGLSSIGARQQSLLAKTFRTAMADVDPEYASRIRLVAERRPVFEEALEFHRQRVWLRERMPAEVSAPEQTQRDAKLIRPAHDRGQFAYALWLDRRVAQGQFDLDTDIPEPLTAIATVDDNAGRLHLGLLPAGMTPVACQEMVHEWPLIVLTTHHTLARHGDVLALLQTIEPVYVLMDLPVDRHVKHWIAGGVLVRTALIDVDDLLPVNHPHGAGLSLLIFAVTRNHPFRFLCIGGNGGIKVLADQMQRRYPKQISVDPSLLEEHRPATAAVIGFVLRSWHLLHQGGEPIA